MKVSSEQQVPLNDVRTEAGAILDELGHTFGIGKVRCFAYALIKIFKALFNRVYVNEEGIQMVNVFLVSCHMSQVSMRVNKMHYVVLSHASPVIWDFLSCFSCGS